MPVKDINNCKLNNVTQTSDEESSQQSRQNLQLSARKCLYSHKMPTTTLTDLPPEILDEIISYLPTAGSLANLSISSRSLHSCIVKEGWKTFATTKFPSLCPVQPSSYEHASRSLTTLSRAIDRRAFVARYIKPDGHITAFPGGRRIQSWNSPKGQTIGFTPQLDVYEEFGPTWGDRREVLAFSAGAELVVRETFRQSERSSWMTYRPLSANEGRDDITSVNLLRPPFQPAPDEQGHASEHVIVGTANGDLQLVSLPNRERTNVVKTYYTTQGQPVRSTSLLQPDSGKRLLAANLGDSQICLYDVDFEDDCGPKIAPSSEIDVFPATGDGITVKGKRIWSTKFLSPKRLAVGFGPSEGPVAVHELRNDGLSKEPIRTFGVQNSHEDRCDELAPGGVAPKLTRTIYPIVPLPPYNAASGSEGDLFLSGGYDGIIRLHDMRSNKDVEQTYIDPTEDNAVYSLLPRGRETIIAGTSRNAMLKFFDMRMGAKCYQYQDISPENDGSEHASADWNLFLNTIQLPVHGNWARRNRLNRASSVYSLAASSHHSPYIYAGIEGAVAELAFTSVIDKHPDPVAPHGPSNHLQQNYPLELSCYSQGLAMKLMSQGSVRETFKSVNKDEVSGLDGRWRLVR